MFQKKNHIKDKFTNCPIFNKSKNYGYIITKYIQQNKVQYINDFQQFIINLEPTIENFIKPLYEVGYILNIDFESIQWNKKENKVYIDFLNITKDTNKDKDIQNLIACILKLLKNINNTKYDYTEQLLNYFINDENMTIDKLIKYLDKINTFTLYDEDNDKITDEIIDLEQPLSNDKYAYRKKDYTKHTYLSQSNNNLINEQINFLKNQREEYKKLKEQLFKELKNN